MNATLMAPNAQYQSCMDALNKCAQLCQECLRLCLEEPDMNMREHCMLDLMDCAEVCSTAACAMARRSKHLKEILNLCSTICEECASECNRFKSEHNNLCADACRHCAEECRKVMTM
ncbi:four-helix bundle copper-binding protein [Clostridium sp. CX1]|uniref:Four-helix bundle copper-binding protein n=1 Tax=Clostridium tanneri TaxID=3037988 RepID=A0ABU4JTZ9_9CLOT|nr:MULTISPECIES: four-helix bundle copper-binding protein [unclassified Clostridium]MCT8975350.1 four-helix bundle copper-binding protein [Clostridium sp. CX1]MDW8801419.1 four-helix bundle copper-binding protein [Clostridium sp. A1-XYC3]